MKTGKQTVDIDGENFTFKFKDSSSRKGAGIVGEDDHKLYNAGKLVKAGSDDKYKVVEYDEKTGISTTMSTEDFLEGRTPAYNDKDEEWKWDFSANVDDKDNQEQKLYYLVNTSGSMVKRKSAAKDGDDYKFEVENYLIKSVTLDD